MLYYPARCDRSLHFNQVSLHMSIMVICNVMEHFNINRILLLSVGLWPFQRTKFVRCQVLLFFVILITFIIFQVR